MQALNPGASVHRAAFLTATELYALSHDERLALYDVAEGYETGAAKVDFGDVRAALGGEGEGGGGCQYVADISPKANGAGAVVGAGAHDRQMFELVHLTNNSSGGGGSGGGWTLDRENSVGLPGAHGSEIVRSFCFYDEAGTVFTAGEDGFIRAWR